MIKAIATERTDGGLVQWFVCVPNGFMQTEWVRLLPSWTAPVTSVVIVLQQSPAPLTRRSSAREADKAVLRKRFLQWGSELVHQLQMDGYLADLFDPKTGLPQFSPPGSLTLDDVAVVRSLLHYPVRGCGNCWVVSHPVWGEAVYPATILSSAPVAVVEGTLRKKHQLWPQETIAHSD